MSIDVHFSSVSNEWETPKSLFASLNREFNFDLDAAATKENALCENFFTIQDDSLSQDWSQYKNIWCNPPYGRLIGKFVEKAFNESKKGCTVVMLIPARVDTKYFQNFCSLGQVLFIKGRLKFINKSFPSYREDGDFKVSPAPFPSAIVVFKNGQQPSTSYGSV